MHFDNSCRGFESLLAEWKTAAWIVSCECCTDTLVAMRCLRHICFMPFESKGRGSQCEAVLFSVVLKAKGHGDNGSFLMDLKLVLTY